MNKRAAVCLALGLLCVLPVLVSAQEDEPGCKDHPLFTRMKGFVIYECESNFDAVEFYVGEDKAQTLEGQKTRISYSLPEGEPTPSELQILRNFENAAKAIGGAVVYKSDIYLSMKIVKCAGRRRPPSAGPRRSWPDSSRPGRSSGSSSPNRSRTGRAGGRSR